MSTWPAPRAPTLDEWPMLRAALNEVFRPPAGAAEGEVGARRAAGDRGDLTRELPLFLNPANRANLRVVRDVPWPGGALAGPEERKSTEGRIVAHAGFVSLEALVLGRRLRVACVGAVFVLEAHRGRGLGTAVLEEVLRAARADRDLVLVSGARGLYRRQGLAPIAPLARFQLPVVEAGRSTRFQTRDVVPGDIDTLMELYNDSDVHFIRTGDDWRAMVGAAVLVNAPARFAMVTRSGTPVAYLVAQEAAAPSGDDDGDGDDGGATAGHRRRGRARVRAGRILELAGDRRAIAEAAPRFAEELLVPLYDSQTIALGERAGWPRTTRSFPMSAQWSTGDATTTPCPWYGLNYV